MRPFLSLVATTFWLIAGPTLAALNKNLRTPNRALMRYDRAVTVLLQSRYDNEDFEGADNCTLFCWLRFSRLHRLSLTLN
jgi:hypothetical protein